MPRRTSRSGQLSSLRDVPWWWWVVGGLGVLVAATLVDEARRAGAHRCGNCDAVVYPNADKCWNCGAHLHWD